MAKKQAYRLQALLEIRQRTKEQKEQELGQCLQRLEAEKDRLAEMKQKLEEMVQDREQRTKEYANKQMRGEMSAQAMLGAQSYLERLKESEALQQELIRDQELVVGQRQDEVQAAREMLLEATQDLKTLEKHKEKWEEKNRKERQAKEEQEQDQVAQTVFLNRDK